MQLYMPPTYYEALKVGNTRLALQIRLKAAEDLLGEGVALAGTGLFNIPFCEATARAWVAEAQKNLEAFDRKWQSHKVETMTTIRGAVRHGAEVSCDDLMNDLIESGLSRLEADALIDQVLTELEVAGEIEVSEAA